MVAAQSPAPPPPAEETPASSQPGLFNEPRGLAKGIAWIEARGDGDNERPSARFYAELGHMVTGAGWIAAGPGFRQPFWGGRMTFDASAALSWRGYKMAQSRVEFPRLADRRLAVGAQVLWQDLTQVRYFGGGRTSLETATTDYRLRAADVVAFATWHVSRHLRASGGVGVLSRPRLSSSAGPFDRGEPDTLAVFADEPGARGRQPRFVHADAAIAHDTRDHPGYPRSGGLYRAGWSTYRDRADGTLSFNRWELEAAQFVPVARGRGVLALHAWTVFSDPGEAGAVPFYLLPSLGGHNTLRGYADYRFHDRHLMAVSVESRWALWPHLDAAFFFDAGNVAARVTDLDLARTSAGFGLRLHTTKTTLARFDVGHSAEGWRIMFKLSDSFRMGRLNKRTAAIPFVP
jgi:hypothetical protein